MKRFLFSLFLLTATLTSISTSTQAQNNFWIKPVAMGIGVDIDGSFGALNWGIPIEVRLGRPSDLFTFHIGERISFHRGGDDSATYWDPFYGLWLYEPTVSFTQFSTYFQGRLNFHRAKDFSAFVGAGYYLNFNVNPRMNLDIPNISYINNNYVYTFHDGTRRFYCDDLINNISHSLRFEIGIENPIFDFSFFMSFDLTRNFKRNVIKNNVYYDRYCNDRDVRIYPLNEHYSAINLGSLEDIDDATRDILFVGCSFKFFLFSGYFKNR